MGWWTLADCTAVTKAMKPLVAVSRNESVAAGKQLMGEDVDEEEDENEDCLED